MPKQVVSRPKQVVKLLKLILLFLYSVKVSSSNARKKILIHVFINNKKCVFELDTGIAVTCMNVKKFRSLCLNVPIEKTDIIKKNLISL